ncbi:unnamed protein product [Mesocestoides corti]|nr:unnamed protein product [Mesocestoides corti]
MAVRQEGQVGSTNASCLGAINGRTVFNIACLSVAKLVGARKLVAATRQHPTDAYSPPSIPQPQNQSSVDADTASATPHLPNIN